MAVPRFHNYLKREVLWITEKDTRTHTYIFSRTILLSSICGHLESIKKVCCNVSLSNNLLCCSLWFTRYILVFKSEKIRKP